MKLDLNLLKRLLVIDHPSRHEWPMLSFIINECYKIGNLEFELDGYANILVTKNTTDPEYYPTVVAHTDCVLANSNKETRIKDGKIFGRNKLTGKQIGLGADDANGICVALQLLKVIPDLKVCFMNEEEIGYNGSEFAADNINFFYNSSYLIQADRRGKSDLITYTNGIYSASEEWLQEATKVMAKYKYSEQYGIGTDIGILAEKLRLSGVNVSCGYQKEHTDKEYTVIADLQNCLNFMEELILTVPTDRQYLIDVKYKPYTYEFKNDYLIPKDRNSSPIEYDNWEYWCNHCKDFDCMNCPHDFKWY